MDCIDYVYDPAGSVTRKGYESRGGDPAEEYNHDALHRLTIPVGWAPRTWTSRYVSGARETLGSPLALRAIDRVRVPFANPVGGGHPGR